MRKFLETKRQKIWASASLVWLVLMYAGTMTGYSKDSESFFIFGLAPIVIGWGIHIIWYDRSKTKVKKKTKIIDKKKENKWVEFAALLGGILLYKAVGLMGCAAVGAGYGIYFYVNKAKFSKIASISLGVVGGSILYFFIILIYSYSVS